MADEQAAVGNPVNRAEAWYEEWRDIGLSTEPADRFRAERAIRAAYRLAGPNVPAVQWVASPRVLVELVAPYEQARDPGASPIGPVWAALNARRREPSKVRPVSAWLLWYRLQATVVSGFHEPVWRAAVNAAGTSVLRHWLLGQVDVAQVAAARYRQACGYDEAGRQSEQLALREELVRSAGWVWAWEDVCVLCDRPAEVHTERHHSGFDRVHRADGPAVTFRDGVCVWAWHGVELPRRAVEDSASLRPTEIRTEPEPRKREALLDLYGLDRFLAATGTWIVDRFPDGGRIHPAGLRGACLHLVPWGLDDDEPLVAVSLVDPVSGARHALRVPPRVKSVREAVAWTFGFDEPEAYAPNTET